MKTAILKTATLTALVSSMAIMGVAYADEPAANPNTVMAGTPYEGTLTGNINVYSKYILRGITQTYGPLLASGAKGSDGPEMDSPALQGGLDYVLTNGLYVGYWFSTLGYSYASLNPDASGKHSQNSTESDIYGGYTGTLGTSGIGFTLGGTVYVYTPGWESTGYETKVGLSFGEVGVTAQTLLNDVTWGNEGDTYFLATWTHALPKDFTFIGQVGAYAYKKDGQFFAETPDSTSFGFRHATVALSHPLPIKGGTWGVQYIVGGDNRYGVKQDNQIVGSLGLTF